MTTEASSCVLLAGLAALQDPEGWTGRPVHCQDRGDVLYQWPDDALTAPTYLVAARSYLLGEATPPSLGERGRLQVRFLCDAGQRWYEFSRMSNSHRLMWLTREILLAALAARWAAIIGDHDTVDDFTRNVLGHAEAAQWRHAVTGALLGDWVDRLGGYLTDPELLKILRTYTAAERRRWTEVWEHRLGGFHWRAPDGTVRVGRGKRVWMLETPNRDGVTVRDVYPDKPAAGALALDHDFTDPGSTSCSAASMRRRPRRQPLGLPQVHLGRRRPRPWPARRLRRPGPPQALPSRRPAHPARRRGGDPMSRRPPAPETERGLLLRVPPHPPAPPWPAPARSPAPCCPARSRPNPRWCGRSSSSPSPPWPTTSESGPFDARTPEPTAWPVSAPGRVSLFRHGVQPGLLPVRS